jgi:hypothetical protein
MIATLRMRRRLRAWDRGRIELSAEEQRRYLAEEDGDIVLITDYLMGDLSAEMSEDVEQRLRHDPAFFRASYGIIEAWDRACEHRLDAAFARAAESERVRWVMIAIGVAVGVLLILVGAIGFQVYRATAERQAFLDGRVSVADLNFRHAVTAGSRDSAIAFKVMDIDVRAHSTLSYGAMVIAGGGTGYYGLEGAAAFHSWAGIARIRTAEALIKIGASRVAIASVPGTHETRITVDSGAALVLAAADTTKGARISAGMRAVITADGHVTVGADTTGFPSTVFSPPAGSIGADTAKTRAMRESYRKLVGGRR